MGNDIDKPNMNNRYFKPIPINDSITLYTPLSLNDMCNIENAKCTNPSITEIKLQSNDKINIMNHIYYPYLNNDNEITTTIQLKYDNLETNHYLKVFRTERFSINNNNSFSLIQPNTYETCSQVKLFYYRDLFEEVSIDLNDEFIISFTNHVELLPIFLHDYFTTKIKTHLTKTRKIKESIFDFEKMKQILKNDFTMHYNLFNYIRTYFKIMDRFNFVEIIAKMLSEEGDLYSMISEPLAHIYLGFFYLIILYIMSKRSYHNVSDKYIYMAMSKDFLDMKETFIIGNIISNKKNFISCTKSYDIIKSIVMNSNNDLNIIEIKCSEPNYKYPHLINGNFDLSRFSVFNTEFEVMLKPYSYFEINEIDIIDDTKSLFIKTTLKTNFYNELLLSNQLSQNMKNKFGVCDNVNDNIEHKYNDVTIQSLCAITFNTVAHIKVNTMHLGCMKNLYSLDISNTNINDNDLINLTPYILNLTSLKYLNLSQNSLTKVSISFFVNSFKMLKNIEILNLNQNELSDDGIIALSSQLEQLKKLNTLSLMYNKIKSNGLVSLCKKLSLLTKLTHLNLSANFILYEEIEPFITTLNNLSSLLYLNIANNQIMSDGLVLISGKLHKMPQLQYVNISENCIKSKGFISFAENMKYCPNIHTLVFYGNQIGYDGMKAIVNNLYTIPKLRELNIGFNLIGDDELKMLAKEIGSVPLLEVLNLRENVIGNEGIKYLLYFVAIKPLKYLEMVDFSWNQITYTNGGKSACVNSINDFSQIIKITKSFMNIQLENNPIQLNDYCNLLYILKSIEPSWTYSKGNYTKKHSLPDYDDIVHKYIEHTSNNSIKQIKITSKNINVINTLNEFTNLNELDISSQKIGMKGMQTLCKHLVIIGNSIKTLNLSGNEIGDDGFKLLIVNCFDKLKKIKALNLRENKISNESMIIFSDNYYKIQRTLKYLNLSWNRLSNEGMLSLSKCDLSRIEVLKIRENEIGVDGITHLTSSFNKMSNISVLDLCWNNITSNGIEVLCKELSHLKSLKQLNISKNGITEANVIEMLCNVLIQLRSIEILSLNENNINNDCIEIIMKYISNENCSLKTLNISNNNFTVDCKSKLKLTCEQKQININI